MSDDTGRKIIIVDSGASLLSRELLRKMVVNVGDIAGIPVGGHFEPRWYQRTFLHELVPYLSFARRHEHRIKRYQRLQPKRFGDYSKWIDE